MLSRIAGLSGSRLERSADQLLRAAEIAAVIGQDETQRVGNLAVLRALPAQIASAAAIAASVWPALLKHDRLLIEQVRMTGCACQRIVQARQRLLGLPAIGEQLRLRDLGLARARPALALFDALQQLQRLTRTDRA